MSKKTPAPPPAAKNPAPKEKPRRRWWIVLLVAFGIAVLGGALGKVSPILVALVFLGLLALAVYAFVRGSVPRLGMHGRASGAFALASAFLLVIGAGATAAENSSPPAIAEATPHSFAAVTERTPIPRPIPTTFSEIEEKTVIPFERTIVDDAERDLGTTTVTVTGVDGEKVTTYRVTSVAGTEVSREQIREVVTVQPVAEVTARGTRDVAVAEPVPFAAQEQPECHPSYEWVCVPFASDVDCAGGSGDGPEYVSGPIKVIGHDEYQLDRDKDGIACD
ncbi:MAG: G5 domain-containing protein [Microbacterium sp.]